ncbi:MAG: hypothetical protein ACMUJM_23120 [bacterium]
MSSGTPPQRISSGLSSYYMFDRWNFGSRDTCLFWDKRSHRGHFPGQLEDPHRMSSGAKIYPVHYLIFMLLRVKENIYNIANIVLISDPLRSAQGKFYNGFKMRSDLSQKLKMRGRIELKLCDLRVFSRRSGRARHTQERGCSLFE